MSVYIFKRCIRALLTLWVVATLVFFITRLTGDPTSWLLPDDASPEARALLLKSLGLDQPLLTQYRVYFENMWQGEFGISFYERRAVTEMFIERIPATLQLALLSLVTACLLGVTAGTLAALMHNSWFDRLIMSLSFVAYATPNFVIGIGLIFLFSLLLGVLPTSGRGSWQQLIMPVFTLGASSAALIARLTRSSLLDTINQDYIRTAKAKGLQPRSVILKHAFKNASIPLLTLLGMQVGTLITGSVVVETVFAWPGLGRTIVTAVTKRDFPVLQLAVLVVASSVVIANFMVDIGYSAIDPRVRVES